MKYEAVVITALILALLMVDVKGADLAKLIADRAAVEKVYYSHRLGTKPSFEETLPPALLERLVKLDLKKETALKKIYGVEITPAVVDAEVQRINSTTRAPDVLAELKLALGNDPIRFAETVARPIVVERELRRRFENDDTLHAAERRQVEQIRGELLAAKSSTATPPKLLENLRSHQLPVQDVEWLLTPRPAEAQKPDDLEIKKKFGQNAQILSAPETTGDQKFYFDDLEPQLRNVLKAQLRDAGDVSAVIETPNSFLLYLLREKKADRLEVSSLTVPKRGYETWLEAQSF